MVLARTLFLAARDRIEPRSGCQGTSASCLASFLNLLHFFPFKCGSLAFFNFQSTLPEDSCLCLQDLYLLWSRPQGDWAWAAFVPIPNLQQGPYVTQFGPGICLLLNQPKWPKWRLERGHNYDVDLSIRVVLGKGAIWADNTIGVSCRSQITYLLTFAGLQEYLSIPETNTIL